MRLVTYYDSNGAIHPVVINKSKLLYRLDILRPNTVELNQLQNGKSYSGAEVLTSIIYDGFSVTRFTAGPTAVIIKFINELPKDVLRELIYNLEYHADFFFKDGTKLGIYGKNNSAGTSTKLKGVNYDKRALRIIDGDNTFYSSKEIKTMEYFRATKNIDFDSKDYTCLDTYEAVQAYVDSQDWSRKIGALDTETNGTTFFFRHDKNNRMVGMSHSYKKNQGVYIMFRYKGEQVLEYERVLEIIKPILDARNIYQNGSFDYRVLRRHGVKVYVFWELMNILQLTNPDPHKPKALKTISPMLLDEDPIELDEILGPDFDAELVEWIDKDLITFYACGDTDKTRTIGLKLHRKLPKATQELLDFDMYNYNEICVADWYGFPADWDLLQKVYSGVMKDKVNMENYILDFINTIAPPIQARKTLIHMGVAPEKITEELIVALMATEDFNRMLKRKMTGLRQPRFELDYDGDKQRIFYTLLNYPQIRFTKSGALSVGKDYFNDLCKYKLSEPTAIVRQDLLTSTDDTDTSGNPIKLLEKDTINSLAFPLGYMFREYNIVCNKATIYKRLIGNYCNGRTFETYRFTSTATGRLSSAIHTIAGYAKGIIGHRAESQYALLIFDADQIEFRGVHNEAIRMWDYMMSRPEMIADKDNPLHKYSYQSIIDIFNNVESDSHTEMAAQFNHVSRKEVTPAMRKRGKIVAFSGTYGARSSTMAKGELAQVKTEAEQQAVLTSYANTKESWLSTNLHLKNYFEMTKNEPLFAIPQEDIPFNIEEKKVGMTCTRTGRRRFYPLDGADAYTISRIQNRGRNQYIQSLCRDIIFVAISNLSKAIKAEGFTDEQIRGLLYVHDEEGIEYDKTVFNPLWLLAMCYKYCCVEIEGHKIKYYVTPAIVNNWAEGKSDYYEVPKGMLAKLSTNLSDYEPLTDTNHRDYVVKYTEAYYQDEMLKIFEETFDCGIVDTSVIDIDTRYNFFKRAGLHTIQLRKALPVPELNIVFNHVANHPNAGQYTDCQIMYNGNSYYLKDFISETIADTFSVDEFDLSGFEIFDNAEEYEAAQKALLSFDEAVKTVVNYKTIQELNNEYSNTPVEKSKNSMDNIYFERYFSKATITLGKTARGVLPSKAVATINRILKEAASPTTTGIHIDYYIDRQLVDSGITIVPNFDLKKFDTYINSLRKES